MRASRSAAIPLAAILLLIVGSLSMVTPHTFGQSTEPEELLTGDRKRETMRDLTGVEVVVEPMPPDAEQDGLSTSLLQAEIEAQLQQAGIRVFTAEERRSQPGRPFLYLSITTVKNGGIYSYAIDLSLNQTVILSRHRSIATFAPTWSMQAAGMVSASHVGLIQEHLREGMSRFIRDYSSINPEEQSLRLMKQ